MPISYQLIEKNLRFFAAINIILNFIPFELGLKKTYENNAKLALTLKIIPALSFVPLSDVESAFTLVIDKICQTADQFDIPTDIFEKIDKLASYFQKTYIKKKQLVDNSVILCSPQLYGIITTTRRPVSFLCFIAIVEVPFFER